MYNGNRRYESSGRTKKVYGRGKGKATDRSPMKEGTDEELRSALLLLDHRSYAAYKSLAGSYRFGFYTLFIDHVQGDPFAAPSRLRVEISSGRAGFPEKLRSTPETRRALQDDLTRRFYKASRKYDRKAHGSGKSGAIGCSNPGQEILERSCCQFGEDGSLTFRFTVGFPAAGRTILAKELEKILFSEIPSIVSESLLYSSLNPGELRKTADLAEDQTELRRSILERGFIAFVADGSVLPRESGVSQKPLKNAVAFRSPDEDRISVTLPHVGEITGMGIRRGITLVIGGGYHGKSTLLQALERGVYDHIAGDGREFVVTDDTAVKIRAEDGRAVRSVNISPFIRDLPSGKKTESFSSDDASGSTSQAAACAEAVESGAKLLLMDEDTCAANFMVRDPLMQRIVSQEQEPIVPYSRTMRPLFENLGVSTILVAGSSGAFFRKADTVIQMDRYQPKDVTAKVREVLKETGERSEDLDGAADPDCAMDPAHAGDRNVAEDQENAAKCAPAFPDASVFSKRVPEKAKDLSDRNGRIKRKNLGQDGFMIGRSMVDLRAVEQIADWEQTECLSLLSVLCLNRMDGKKTLSEIISGIWDEVQEKGFSALSKSTLPGNLALPRKQEFYSALNRMRDVRMRAFSA